MFDPPKQKRYIVIVEFSRISSRRWGVLQVARLSSKKLKPDKTNCTKADFKRRGAEMNLCSTRRSRGDLCPTPEAEETVVPTNEVQNQTMNDEGLRQFFNLF